MDQLDTQLDSIFTDTFHNFGSWFGQSKLAASVDLRDQKDKYVARVYLPDGEDTSKVNAKVENGSLHITAEGEQASNGSTAAERFEQVLSLPGPVQADKMNVERKKNLVVVTLPKSPAATTTAKAAPPSPPLTTMPLVNWDQSVINQMAHMQGRMDQILADTFPEDNFMKGAGPQNFGSAVNVDDQKDKYVVHFYLPNRNLSNVNVKLDKGQLHLSAKEQNEKKTANATAQSFAQYQQTITLPGPVKDQGMKVERKDATIVVTVPKA